MARAGKCRRAFLSAIALLTPIAHDTTTRAEAATANPSIHDLKRMSLEDLADLEVTIVSKRPEPLREVPAAVFVITSDDIRRSGVTNLADLLRMVPGVSVARIDTGNWAITSRGFNGQFANKLLVLIDGRSVYTPLFSGVFWQAQDTFMGNIDRIEVIRGPGAASWGANAVNGVVNIITKNTLDAEGGLAVPFGGNQERGAGAQFSGRVGQTGAYRIYATGRDRDAMPGLSSFPSWEGVRGGFRTDWMPDERQSFTLQGDVYEEDLTPDVYEGLNVLGRWDRTGGAGRSSTLQLYFDRTELDSNALSETLDTVDLEFRFRPRPSKRHDLVLGTGVRRTTSKITAFAPNGIVEPRRSDMLFSAFVQDDIRCNDRWFLTAGTKLEENDYSGFEFQPSLRLRWLAGESTTVWGAVSRAVRTPSRGEDDFRFETQIAPPSAGTGGLPVVSRLEPHRGLDSEELVAYELGMRWQGTSRFAVDAALFYNDYDELRTVDVAPGPPVLDPLPSPRLVVASKVGNNLRGSAAGAEVLVDWRPRPRWQLQTALSVLDISLTPSSASTDPLAEQPEGESPEKQLSVRSMMNLPADFELDLWVRLVDELPALDVEAYETLDLRFAWRPLPEVQLALIGRNLLEDRHQEFGNVQFTNGASALVEREFLFRVGWDF